MNYFDIRKLYEVTSTEKFDKFEVPDWFNELKKDYIASVPGVVNRTRDVLVDDTEDNLNREGAIRGKFTDYLYNTDYGKKIKANTVAGLLQEFQDAYTRVNSPAIFEIECTKREDISVFVLYIEFKGYFKVLIDWGDGNKEEFDSSNGQTEFGHEYDYSKPGKYTVKVYNRTGDFYESNAFNIITGIYSEEDNVIIRVKNAIPVSFYSNDSEEGNCYLNCTYSKNSNYKNNYTTVGLGTDSGSPFYTYIGNECWKEDDTVAKPTEIITPIYFTVGGKFIDFEDIGSLYCNCIVRDPDLLINNPKVNFGVFDDLYIQSEDLNSFKILFDYIYSRTERVAQIYILAGKYQSEALEYVKSKGRTEEVYIVDRNPYGDYTQSLSRSVKAPKRTRKVTKTVETPVEPIEESVEPVETPVEEDKN